MSFDVTEETTAISQTRPPASLEDQIQALGLRARGGDRTAVPQLRKLFDQHPERLMLLGGGDMAEVAKAKLIDKIVRGDDVVGREAKLRRIDQLRDELAGPNPTPIERLLADRAALCWAELHNADARIFGLLGEGLDTRRAAFLDQYRDRAHRRYLTALKTLATVRKLAVPVLQLNLANQHINQIVPISPE
jgi:hypothetical protein